MEVSIYFTVNAAAMAAARLFGGRVTRRMGVGRSMLVATLLCMAAFLLIPLSSSVWGLWTASVLHGLGYGTIYPMLNAMAVTKAAPERRGTAMATFLTGMDIGVGFGAGFWGLVIDHTGMDTMFYICAAVSLTVYVAYRLLMPQQTDSKQSEGKCM